MTIRSIITQTLLQVTSRVFSYYSMIRSCHTTTELYKCDRYNVTEKKKLRCQISKFSQSIWLSYTCSSCGCGCVTNQKIKIQKETFMTHETDYVISGSSRCRQLLNDRQRQLYQCVTATTIIVVTISTLRAISLFFS